MNIVNDRLRLNDGTQVRQVPSPNVGGLLRPRFLVMHYTAGASAESSINWLASPKSKVSAHLVIARDGAITQLVPFNVVAWHAGASEWKGVTGLNRHSIGIELDNPGPVRRSGAGRWRSVMGQEFRDEDVMVAFHKLEKKSCGWVKYPARQIDAAVQAARAIVAAYGIEEIVGHEDIAPTRKTDPGPAFPMGSFVAQVRQSAATVVSNLFVTTGEGVNVRRGAGTQFEPVVANVTLPRGVLVEVLAADGSWRHVDVLDATAGVADLQGWVHSRYLAFAPDDKVRAFRIAGGAEVPAGA